MMAFASDWHEQEGDPQTGRLWRWTTDRSTIEIRNTRGDVRLTIEGESPLLNFDRPPVVVVAAGGAELARFNPAADFRQTIDVPAGVLAAAGGRVTIATDLVFVPGEREASPDRRRLGLRILDVQVTGR